MANYVAGLNPEVLRWAREVAGYSVEEVSARLGKSAGVVEDWESGTASPTYGQLERLAYEYKRPIAVFFFPSPPKEIGPGTSFRTLPDFEIEALEPDTRYALRQAQAKQLALMELSGGINLSQRQIFRDIQITPRSNPEQTAVEIRAYLGVSLEIQIGWKDVNEALTRWRSAVQNNGIFVFKRSFRQEDVSGFCLVHKQFPVIYINNSTAKSRQIFTLFHELAHLLLNVNGVTKTDDRYIQHLEGDARDIEVFCNKLAAELLVPTFDFNAQIATDVEPEQLAARLARRYKVSREVILRRLLDQGLVTREFYELKAYQWSKQYKDEQAQKGSGGNYYATQATYLGENYLELAFRTYYQGDISLPQLADYLEVKVNSVAGLEQFVFRPAASI